MRSMLNEKDLKAEVKKLLNQHGWFWWMPPANGFGKSNVDFNALRDGVFMAIETKFTGRKCTPLQLGYLSSINAEQGFGLIVFPDRLEALATFLTAFDAGRDAIQNKTPVAADDGATMLDALATLTQELAPKQTIKVGRRKG